MFEFYTSYCVTLYPLIMNAFDYWVDAVATSVNGEIYLCLCTVLHSMAGYIADPNEPTPAATTLESSMNPVTTATYVVEISTESNLTTHSPVTVDADKPSSPTWPQIAGMVVGLIAGVAIAAALLSFLICRSKSKSSVYET